MPTGARIELTQADTDKMRQEFADHGSINKLAQDYEIGFRRAKRIATGPRHTADSLPNAGSEAQLNNGYEFSTAATALPPKHRKAATTPRKRWIEVEDFCDQCAGTFSIHAPAHVAGKVHGMWVRWHETRCGVRMTGDNGVVVAGRGAA